MLKFYPSEPNTDYAMYKDDTRKFKILAYL